MLNSAAESEIDDLDESKASEADDDSPSDDADGQQFNCKTIDCLMISNELYRIVEASNPEMLDIGSNLTSDGQTIAMKPLGPIRLVVLSSVPFPDAEMADCCLHPQFLLCLAEFIDIVFLGAFKDDELGFFVNKFAFWYGKARRPKSMPTPALERLSRTCL
ncbi:hypothetical protein MHUMG1_08452 [Metarhizium humberi]|uniref:Uncharacterized protein n=1 Tax=Metarhizium humberi TaxID=2596975 RepID=A0A9P8S4F5_9HYPO|nr:hypothetical protein MHUMG1_08452 [Metarhizium humberi]